MRETKNLKLTQFDPNDIPNWLDQYNSDMEKIDTVSISQSTTNKQYESRFDNDEGLISNNRAQINENTQDIANIKVNVNNIKGGSATSIADLESEVNTVSQSLKTLKGSSTRTIDEIDSDLSDDKTAITSLGERVETIEGTTTAMSIAVSKIGTTLQNNKTTTIPSGTEVELNRIVIESENDAGYYIATAMCYYDADGTGYRLNKISRYRNKVEETLGLYSTNAVNGTATLFTFNTFPFEIKKGDVIVINGLQTSSNGSLGVTANLSLFRLK